ncbi:MAG: energy transducer TonB [Gemmatimonadetes bacterium]|nr:energy transducer TonB [Gemmatimonadota bacterium]
MMTLRLPRAAVLAGAALLVHAGAARAQTPNVSVRAAGQHCSTVPDTIKGPTPGQIAERAKLREQLVAIGRRNGVTEPQGLLLVDVDSTRKGKLLFMETNYPAAGVEQVTGAVAEYLRSLPQGRGYQALIRVDGEYPAMLPGRQHCTPVLITPQDRVTLIERAVAGHPDRGKVAQPLRREALVLLVSNREGRVAFASVIRSSGDEYLDRAAEEIGRNMKFTPATLDGIPLDARFRFPVGFTVQ